MSLLRRRPRATSFTLVTYLEEQHGPVRLMPNEFVHVTDEAGPLALVRCPAEGEIILTILRDHEEEVPT